VLAGEQADAYVTRLSRVKAEAVAARAPGEVILAADTTVALRERSSRSRRRPRIAVEMLEQLQGQTHKVLTAVAVSENGRLEQALDVTRVTSAARSRDARGICRHGEPLDKAGAYAIQGLGAPLIERVEGDFSE